MRLFLLLLLFLASGLLTTSATAQDDSFLVPNPASVDTSQNAYYATSREPSRPEANLEVQRPPASRISAVMPPVDFMTREPAASDQSAISQVTPVQASVSVDELVVPAFAKDVQMTSNALDPGMISVAQPKTVWPAQTSPFPINPTLQHANHSSQSQNQPATLPSATSNADEYYVPTIAVAATKTSTARNFSTNHRPIQPAVGYSKSAGHTSKCCDEWKDFWPCKHPDFDSPCGGTSEDCGGRANCQCAGKRKHCKKGRGAGCGAQNGCSCSDDGCQCKTCRGKRRCGHSKCESGQTSTCTCDDATGNDCNSAQCDGSCKGKAKSRRFSLLQININR